MVLCSPYSSPFDEMRLGGRTQSVNTEHWIELLSPSSVCVEKIKLFSFYV